MEPTSVLVPGPWTHRDVSTNGTRLHIAEIGSGPLVLLVHGFPEFWWSWRHQLTALADAGYHAVACDLRGYGASDKPPRGYDIFTLAADLAGLVRALGERQAIVVGQDCGGFLAWSMAALHPRTVSRLVVSGSAHPLRMRRAIFGEVRGQLTASGYLAGLSAAVAPRARAGRRRRRPGSRAAAALGWPGLSRCGDRASQPRRYADSGSSAQLDGVLPLGLSLDVPARRLADASVRYASR